MKWNVSVVSLSFAGGISLWRIIGQIFFDSAITAVAYIEIFNIFVNQLDYEELSIEYFQQDGATSTTLHTPTWPEIQSLFFGESFHFEGTFGTTAFAST
jgi:hypothetical protein